MQWILKPFYKWTLQCLKEESSFKVKFKNKSQKHKLKKKKKRSRLVYWAPHMLKCSSLGKLWTVSDHLPGEWSLLLDDIWASALVSLIIFRTSLIEGRFSGPSATQAIAMFRSAWSFSSDVSLLEVGSSPDSVSSSRTDRTHLGISEPCSWTRSWKGVLPVRSSKRRTPKLYTSAGWVAGFLMSRHSGAL